MRPEGCSYRGKLEELQLGKGEAHNYVDQCGGGQQKSVWKRVVNYLLQFFIAISFFIKKVTKENHLIKC